MKTRLKNETCLSHIDSQTWDSKLRDQYLSGIKPDTHISLTTLPPLDNRGQGEMLMIQHTGHLDILFDNWDYHHKISLRFDAQWFVMKNCPIKK